MSTEQLKTIEQELLDNLIEGHFDSLATAVDLGGKEGHLSDLQKELIYYLGFNPSIFKSEAFVNITKMQILTSLQGYILPTRSILFQSLRSQVENNPQQRSIEQTTRVVITLRNSIQGLIEQYN
jgi:hypothetical protein